ncbi:chemotaxis protein CheW [Silvibacterium dinghuense]|uniref:Chemotaxis protein CheW n=1 Tax=Silvibacterium dinghuense TaxID=1560006 RepID=A0A4Q1SD48_9BACT|nr:chemotaxis protein CheW [Silvibacterium dinghuense]RXS95144.1 purine-binding chemotaxis protein CheW [Silvibacterium dinghuense]
MSTQEAAVAAITAGAAGEQEQTLQYLTFTLDDHDYGLELFKIQEIRGYAPITPIPNLPPHVRGVMNLRGTVLPVIDLRMKFRLPAIEYNKFTVIVIALVEEKVVGLLVDAISDVLQVSSSSMRPAPDFGTAVDTQFIHGVFQARDHLVVALNLERLLTEGELTLPEMVQ